MALTSLGYTPGTGAQIKTDQGTTSQAHMQVVKLAESAAGSENLIPADDNGLLVQVSSVQSTVPVSASPTAPVSVRLSDGANNVDNVPVTITNTQVPVTGSIGITGTIPVSGTITANQGSPNASAYAWPVKITDGTNTPHLTQVGSNYALDVNVVNQANGTQADKSSFTEGTGLVQVIGGVVNDTPISNPGEDQAAAIRITPYRGAHVNLRDNSGNEIGTTANPMVVLPTAPASSAFWKFHASYTASQTAIQLHDPTGSKTAYVLGFAITTTTGGQVIIYDSSDSSTSELYNAVPGTGTVIVIMFSIAFPLAALGNKLYYSTGSAAVGDISVWGYDQ